MFGLFKKRVDPSALHAAGRAACERLTATVTLFQRLRADEPSQEEVEKAINLSVETQMFAVSVSTTLLNFTIQDAYYDAGLAGPMNPMPGFTMSTDEVRSALRQAWSFLKAPVVRMNIDMRYRYIYVQKLNSPAEQRLWTQMEAWSEYEVRRAFESKQSLNTDWLAFCMALKEGNQAAAREYLGR